MMKNRFFPLIWFWAILLGGSSQTKAQQSNTFWSVDVQAGKRIELGFLNEPSPVRFGSSYQATVREYFTHIGVSRFQSIYANLGFNAGLYLSSSRDTRKWLDVDYHWQATSGSTQVIRTDLTRTSNEILFSIPLQLNYCIQLKEVSFFLGSGFFIRLPGWRNHEADYSDQRIGDTYEPWKWDNYYGLANMLFSLSSRFKAWNHKVGLSINYESSLFGPVSMYRNDYLSLGMHYTL